MEIDVGMAWSRHMTAKQQKPLLRDRRKRKTDTINSLGKCWLRSLVMSLTEFRPATLTFVFILYYTLFYVSNDVHASINIFKPVHLVPRTLNRCCVRRHVGMRELGFFTSRHCLVQSLLKNRHSNQQTMTCLQNINMVAVDTYKALYWSRPTTVLNAFLPVGKIEGFRLVDFILLKNISIGLMLY